MARSRSTFPLQKLNHHPKNLSVTDVESGLQAIEKLRSHPPGFFDLVLTDVMMPDVDGVELLRHVRAEASLRAVPVVMMSANEHAETVFECIRLGAEDYLLKPVGRKEVQHIWQHVWRRQRAVREGGMGGGGEEGGGEGAAEATATEQHQQTPASEAAPSVAAATAAAAAQAAAAAEVVLVEEEGGEHEEERREEAAAAAAAAAASSPPSAPAAAVAASPAAATTTARGATTTPPLPLRPSLTSPAAAAAASARTFPRAAPNALTLSEYLRRRGTRPAPLAAFKLFCSALALLRPLHSAGGCLLRLRPSALVLGAGGALSPCAPATADGRVPPEEEAGYAAPEQLLLGPSPAANASESSSSSSSSVVVGAPADVYALGVLFLELFCPLPDEAGRAAVLAALRHRILPSHVLASRPREAAFVTALVHPDAASRPTIDAILTSGWLPALRDAAKEEAAAMTSAGGGAAAAAAAGTAEAASRPAPEAPRAAPFSSIPVSAAQATAAATAAAALAARAARAKSAVAGEACARPAPPPTALPDAALLIEFLGMVRDARASEAEAEARALAALDADAAEVERRLALLDEQAAEAATEAAAGFLGGGSVRKSYDEEPEAAAAAATAAPADAEASPPEDINNRGQGEGGAQAVPGSSDSDENAAAAETEAATAAPSLAAGEGGVISSPADAAAAKRKRAREEGEEGQGGAKQLQLQRQPRPTTATASLVVSRRRLADPVAAAAADAAADAAAAAAWDRVSAAAPSLEAAFLSRFGGGGGAGANNQRSIEESAAAAPRRALPPAPSSSAANAEDGTSALVSQQRSDRLAAFAADLGRFSRIGQLVEVARIESGGGAASSSSAPSAAAASAASAGRGAVFWSSGDNNGGASASAAAGTTSTSSPSALPPGAVSPEMVCSCAFDRDDDLLATAGVARRVRIYSVSALLGGDEASALAAAASSSPSLRRSVRTGGISNRPLLPCAPPVAEVRASSKLSCVAWNPYVKPLLLVSGYDGRVTLWDAGAEKAAASFDGTERRVWAVDWCGSDAALFASGGDDGVARLWDAGRCSAPAASVDVRANVCSVAFAGGGSSGSSGGKGGHASASSCAIGVRPHLLALGAADRRAYVYDIRNLAEPLAVLGGHQQRGSGGSGNNGNEGVGHRRAVSYVRWAPDGQLVSASTDSRLQRWDIDIAAAASSSGTREENLPAMGNDASVLPSPCPVVATYRGHVNERNFVGLSISDSDGLVATGSEDDAVYVYCGGLPSPVCRHSFVNGGGSGGGGSGGVATGSPSALALPAAGSAAAAASSPPALPPTTQQQQQPSRRSSRTSGRFFVSSLAWAGRGRRLVAADSAGIVKLLELV